MLVRDIGNGPELLRIDALAHVERHVVEIIAVLRHAEGCRRSVGRQQDPVARRILDDLRAGREQGLRAVEQPARDPLVVRTDQVQQHAEIQGNHVHVQPAQDLVFDHGDHEPRVEHFGRGRDPQLALQLVVGHDRNPRGLRAPQVDRDAVRKLMIHRAPHPFPRSQGAVSRRGWLEIESSGMDASSFRLRAPMTCAASVIPGGSGEHVAVGCGRAQRRPTIFRVLWWVFAALDRTLLCAPPQVTQSHQLSTAPYLPSTNQLLTLLPKIVSWAPVSSNVTGLDEQRRSLGGAGQEAAGAVAVGHPRPLLEQSRAGPGRWNRRSSCPRR